MPNAAKVQIDLPAELYERLESEAQRQETSLPELVREAIYEYLEELESEDSNEEIEARFLQGWHEAMTGQTRPARDVLDELHTLIELYQ